MQTAGDGAWATDQAAFSYAPPAYVRRPSASFGVHATRAYRTVWLMGRPLARLGARQRRRVNDRLGWVPARDEGHSGVGERYLIRAFL
jgi:hypothetical protein